MSIVKFKVEFISTEPPADSRVKILRDWCYSFNESGLTPKFNGNGRSLGNLSFRISSCSPAFIITGSTLDSKDNLCDEDFVKVVAADADKMIVVAEGTKDPSSESMMHYEIYKRREDVGAIFHGHDREITSNAALLGLPETGHEELPGSAELMKQVMMILGSEKFIVMKNHGFLSFGETMEQAGMLALQIKSKLKKLGKHE
jgi:L-fuculose-phosphate aldolase